MLTEGQGIPLAVVVAGAHRPDLKRLAATLDVVVVERPEPSPDAPQHVCLDKGDDDAECRQGAAQHAYIPPMRSRGEAQREKRESPDYRARRWVVEMCQPHCCCTCIAEDGPAPSCVSFTEILWV